MAFCAGCGAVLPESVGFCARCGRPAAGPPPIGYSAGPQAPAAALTSGLAMAAGTLVVCSAISVLAWLPLSVPARLISAMVPPGSCAHLAGKEGTFEMFLCSTVVAARTLAGPLAIVALILLLRPVIVGILKRVTPALPASVRFLVGPIVATLLFEIVWAGIHYNTAVTTQVLFPALIGMFTFATMRYRATIVRALGPFLGFRDRFPKVLRIAGVIALPLVLSLVLSEGGYVYNAPLKEQFVAIVALVAGYLAVVKRETNARRGVA